MGKIQKRVIVKVAVDLVVSAGVGILAQNAIKMVMPTDLNKPKMVLAKIGAFAVTSVVTATVSDHISGTIDRAAAGYDLGKAEAAKARQRTKDSEDLARLREQLRDGLPDSLSERVDDAKSKVHPENVELITALGERVEQLKALEAAHDLENGDQPFPKELIEVRNEISELLSKLGV